MIADDEHWMQLALTAARQTAAQGEVPVGAVVIADGRLVAVAGNQPIGLHDPTAHAEILVLREAARQFHNYRLPGTTLYVTLEPCLMCIGAILHARIERLVYGAADPKSGAVSSVFPVTNDPRCSHRLVVGSGVLEQQCSELLRQFFREKRISRTQNMPSVA